MNFPIPILLTLIAAWALPSCSSIPHQDISAAEFQADYLRPRTDFYHFDYTGLHHGYHYLTLYSIGQNGSYPHAETIYRALDTPSITKLVQHPQPPLKPDPKPKIQLSRQEKTPS